jgi:hypothetical protein
VAALGRPEYELVSPGDADAWRVYHDIRREVLFEARGQVGVYDGNRPDDRAAGNHAKLQLGLHDQAPRGARSCGRRIMSRRCS